MTSGVTLSSATRANLLALQNTADLVSTTQNRLSTGKKVNSAIDNASNFFTAASLSSRSSALSTLLDGISNGIQTIQAASQGITSITKLTAQLKSTAQQALASSNAFTAKATSSATLTGAIGTNLLSVGATSTSSNNSVNDAGGTVAVATTTGSVDLSTKAKIDGVFTGSTATFQIDGVTVNLNKDDVDTDENTLVSAINNQLKAGGSGVTVGIDSSKYLKLTGTNDGAAVTLAGTNKDDFFGASPTVSAGKLVATGGSSARALGFANGDTFKINGQTVSIEASDTLDTLSGKITKATNGAVTANFNTTDGKFELKAKDGATAISLADGSTSTAKVAKLGFTTTAFAAGVGTGSDLNALNNTNLTIKVGTGTTATSTTVVFGTGPNQVSTLDQLNAALSSTNAQATIDSTGKLSITTSNEAGAEDLTLSGSATSSVFTNTSNSAVIGGDGNTTRNKLVTDYNNLLNQIDQLSADSGFNGVNLLAGDQVKVIFNEKNTSSVSIKGVSTDSSTLGLSAIGSTDFQDGTKINAVLEKISSANSTLQSQAATFGTNLSVVQNRQDFSKGLINVLDTGAANLTDADLNEEAANSQALTTRQSLGISALSLANQAQQGILQLLR